MTTKSNVLSDLLTQEMDGRYCRETFLAEGAVAMGEVLKNGTNAVTQKKAVSRTAVNQVVTVTTTGTTSAGAITLGFPQANGSMIYTGPIAYDANLATINAALDAALGASKVVATGTIAAIVLTYSGAGYAGTLWALPTVINDLAGSTKITAVLTTAGAAAMAGANTVALNAAASGGKVVCLVRGPAVVQAASLVWPDETTAGEKTAGIALLAAENILAK
jgi:hypothetical protein